MTVQSKSGPEVSTQRLAEIIGANGLFSLGSGLVLLLGALVFDRWFDLPAWVIAAVGASLIPYGLGLRSAASADPFDRRVAWFAASGDFAWVAAAAVLIGVPNPMSAGGKWALAVVTLAVLGFAALQIIQLRRPAFDV